MGRILLTGDTHAQIDRLLFLNDSEMTKEDIVIVLGDFGFIWKDNKYTDETLKLLGEKKCTIAFLDGNHENFSLIRAKETITEWNGGRVGMLPYGVIHLLRGEIYKINGKIVGVCGGANSIDKARRIEGESWWKEEEITDADVDNFAANLSKIKDKKIDIMLSHDAPASLVPLVKLYSYVNNTGETSKSQDQLERILQMANIEKWYFGHWHISEQLDDKFECLYRIFKEIK